MVAAAVGGLRTLVREGETGFLVEGRDPAAFAARVAEILDDPMVARRLGAEAAHVAGGYTWSTAAGRLRRIYDDIAARAPVECRD